MCNNLLLNYLLITSRYLAKLKYSWQIFKFDFFKNETSYKKILFYVCDFFLHVESPPAQLQYNHRPFYIRKSKNLF